MVPFRSHIEAISDRFRSNQEWDAERAGGRLVSLGIAVAEVRPIDLDELTALPVLVNGQWRVDVER